MGSKSPSSYVALFCFAANLLLQMSSSEAMAPEPVQMVLNTEAFHLSSSGDDVSVYGDVNSLLGQHKIEFNLNTPGQDLSCGKLSCTMCKNTDVEECVECSNEDAVITMTNDLVFGVCHGVNFDKTGILEVPESIKCDTKDDHKRMLLPTRWKSCYSGDSKRVYFQTGIVITDKTVKNRFDGSVRAAKVWASALVAESNLVYVHQLNIQIEIGQIYIQMDPARKKTSCKDTWNDKCTANNCIGRRLGELTDWVKCTEDKEMGTWTIIDDIETAPGAGVAYVGAVCVNPLNTAVVSYANGLWRTFAHELGHNFNAVHPMDGEAVDTTNAGIMGYGDGLYNGEYQIDSANRNRVCGFVDKTIETCPAFKDTPQSACGDGIVGTGEECECPAGQFECDCCSKCKLKDGAQCNPISAINGCCKSDCKFASASVTCDDKRGYCDNGQCTHTHPSLRICSVDECKLGLKQATGSDICRLSGWRAQGESLHTVVDGALCDGGGACKGGECKGSTPAPTQPSEPTPFPTKDPTPKPTQKITKQPTKQPTKNPTKRGSQNGPTPFPSAYPTSYPTTPYPTSFPKTR